MNDMFSVNYSRWAALDIFNQMGNIYSEIGRSMNARRRHKVKEQDEAVARAIDLYDLTVHYLISQKSPRVKEVLRAKEQFLAIIYNPASSNSDTEKLDRYFLQFAIAARRTR